jgi:P4 family phage/plasmid primase-like protien
MITTTKDTIVDVVATDEGDGHPNQHLNAKLSRFVSHRAVDHPELITLNDFLNEIRSDRHAEKVARVRAEPDREKRAKLKASLPAVTLSGVCGEGRGGSNSVTEPSGLLQLDFDEVGNLFDAMETLRSDPHIVSVFRSPSHNGLKAIAASDPSDHAGSFRAAENHFREQGLILDPQTKSPKSLCYLSHDPDAWAAPHPVEPLQPIPEETSPRSATPAMDDDMYGAPFMYGKEGPSGLSQVWFGKKFARDERVKFDPKMNRFYIYDPTNGLWVTNTDARMRVRIRDSVLQFLKENGQTHLSNKANSHFQSSVLSQLKGDVETDFSAPRSDDFIHLENGMLDVSTENFLLTEFSPDYLSINQIPISFDSSAKCPRFKGELLDKALCDEDVEAIRLYFGQCLLGRNPTQTLLILTGTPAGGKSQLLNVILKVTGSKNSYELRMEHITSRFEAYNWTGKTLLHASDVKGQFLQTKGVETLKKIVGGDTFNAERKGGQENIELNGEFNVICTTNSRLKVTLDGDAEAWRRRIIIVEYNRPPPTKRIPNFGSLLVQEEGSGILNFALEGVARLKHQLAQGGEFPRSDRMMKKVDHLLAESDSVRSFVRDGIKKREGSSMDVDETLNCYRQFCDAMGWTSLSDRQVTPQLKDLMIELHGEVQQRNPSPRHWKNIEFVKS